MAKPAVTIIRIKPAFRWCMLAVALFGNAFVIWLFVPLIGWPNPYSFSPTFRNIGDNILVFLGLVCGALPLLVIAMLSYLTLFVWQYRVVFGEFGFEVKAPPHLTIKRFKCSYIDIERVVGGEMQGVVTIIAKGKGPLRITVAASLEGGESQLLDVMQQYIDSERFDANIRTTIKTMTRFDKRQLLWAIVMLLLMILWFYSGVGYRFVTPHIAWTSVTNLGWHRQVGDFAIGPNADIWVIDRGLILDSRIVHIVDQSLEALEIPTEAELQAIVPSGYSYGPDAIVVDSLNWPWISLFPHGIIHWNGSDWEWFTFPNGRKDADVSQFLSTNSRIWVEANFQGNDHYEIVIDPKTGSVEELMLPESAAHNDISIEGVKTTPSGSLFVMTHSPGQTGFYWQSGTGWEKAEFDRNALPHGVEAYAMDALGRLWVLSYKGTPCEQNGPSYQIGVYDAPTNIWVWNEIPGDFLCGTRNGFKSMVVDSLNRLWFETDDYVEVFSLTTGPQVKPVVRYTDRNSNYQADLANTSLTITSDGRIWTADGNVVWIDANALELPRPLPAWFTTATSQEINLFVWSPLSLIAMCINLVLTLSVRRRLTSAKVASDAA